MSMLAYYAMLGYSGLATMAPGIEVDVREGILEASSDGRVAGVRGWTPI